VVLRHELPFDRSSLTRRRQAGRTRNLRMLDRAIAICGCPPQHPLSS
jgi:hypothetical protein